MSTALVVMYVSFTQLLSSHFTHFARYYESGQRCFGLASEEEKVWSALVVYRLLETLASKLPHEKLERSCVACLQAVSCAIVPDTLLPSQCQLNTMYQSSAVGYDPRPAGISRVTILRSEVKQFVLNFANFLHDCWVFELVSGSHSVCNSVDMYVTNYHVRYMLYYSFSGESQDCMY